MKRLLRGARLRDFSRNERGVAAIEFAMIAPVLILLLLGTVTLFAATREAQRNEKATFTITDLISRYSDVNDTKLATVNALFDHMVSNTASPIRVSSVLRNDKAFALQWSYAVTPYAKMTAATIPTSRLPDIAVGDTLIIVETQSPRLPMTTIGGLRPSSIDSFATARPRFVAAITKTD